jgi:hypothetical protein
MGIDKESESCQQSRTPVGCEIIVEKLESRKMPAFYCRSSMETNLNQLGIHV